MAYKQKTAATDESVAAFLSSIQHAGRREDAETLLPIFQKITGETPVLWNNAIIGFGRYHYTYDTGHSGTWFRTGFSPRKANMVVYIMPGYTDFNHILADLGKHRKGKSCLYLGRLSGLNLNVLETLIDAGWQDMANRYPAGPIG